MKLHGLVGTQFGDLEYDVGKSVRWLQYFCDDMFIADVNLGNTRYYVVDWNASLPEAGSTIVPIDFFTKPVDFRKAQYALAKVRWDIQPDDWVLFCDAHEGLNIDSRVDPPGWAEEPFRSYIAAVIDAATGPTIKVPFVVYLDDSAVYSVEYENADPMFPIGQDVATPYYLSSDSGSLVRLVQASELNNPAFNWASIDTLGAVGSADTNDICIISYGYAHWHLEDIKVGEVTTPPLTEEVDDGWTMRNLLTQIRPIPGLPVGAWQPQENDPPGVPGPDLTVTTYGIEMLTLTTLPEPGVQPQVAADMGSLLTPLYDATFRFGLRDGLVWKGQDGTNTLGNVPMHWNYDTEQWEATVPPEQWIDPRYPQGA